MYYYNIICKKIIIQQYLESVFRIEDKMDKPYSRTSEKNEYIDSYYSRTLDDKCDFDQLRNDVKTSVCVIGGGMAGVATAHRLVEKGEKPVLIA